MISMKPLCDHVIVLDTIFEDYFCAENDEETYILARNSTKIAAARAAFMIQICTKSFVGWGFA